MARCVPACGQRVRDRSSHVAIDEVDQHQHEHEQNRFRSMHDRKREPGRVRLEHQPMKDETRDRIMRNPKSKAFKGEQRDAGSHDATKAAIKDGNKSELAEIAHRPEGWATQRIEQPCEQHRSPEA